MDFLPSVIRAHYEDGYRIHVTFSDNVEGTVDLQSWLDGPIFEPLKDRSYFQRFFIDGVRWCGPTGRTSRPKRCTTQSSSPVRPNHALEPTAPSHAKGPPKEERLHSGRRNFSSPANAGSQRPRATNRTAAPRSA